MGATGPQGTAGGKSIYQVWGRTTCGAGDSAIHTGFAAAFGGSQGALGGDAMCLDDSLAPNSWFGWNAALVSRAHSNGVAGSRSEYMSTGDLKCAVCKGFSYVLWGRTTCGTGDTALYTGSIAHFNSDSSNGGSANAGPFCVDDTAAVTWVNWQGNSILTRAAGANGNNYSQYLEASSGPCVVCQ